MTDPIKSHTEKMIVNFVDTDLSGYIHFTAALRYFEVSEHHLRRKLLGSNDWFSENRVGFPRVHVECDFKTPLHYPDEIECTARVTHLGRSSVTFSFEIHRDNVLCVVGKIVAVLIKNGEALPLPDDFKAAFEPALSQESD